LRRRRAGGKISVNKELLRLSGSDREFRTVGTAISNDLKYYRGQLGVIWRQKATVFSRTGRS